MNVENAENSCVLLANNLFLSEKPKRCQFERRTGSYQLDVRSDGFESGGIETLCGEAAWETPETRDMCYSTMPCQLWRWKNGL